MPPHAHATRPGHRAPQVEDGDVIRIDASARVMDVLNVSEEEWAQRWGAPGHPLASRDRVGARLSGTCAGPWSCRACVAWATSAGARPPGNDTPPPHSQSQAGSVDRAPPARNQRDPVQVRQAGLLGGPRVRHRRVMPRPGSVPSCDYQFSCTHVFGRCSVRSCQWPDGKQAVAACEESVLSTPTLTNAKELVLRKRGQKGGAARRGKSGHKQFQVSSMGSGLQSRKRATWGSKGQA